MAALTQRGRSDGFGALGDIRAGLYVLRFANHSPLAVYDNNGYGKVVIRPKGMALKPGKFEAGFAPRMQLNDRHLHRRPKGRDPVWVNLECFVSGAVLNLSPLLGTLPNPARVFEAYWLEAIDHFLAREELLDGKRPRGEWRPIRGARWSDNVERDLLGYLRQVQERVEAMAVCAALPSSSSLNPAR